MDRQNYDQLEHEHIINPTSSSSNSLFRSDEAHGEDNDDESQSHYSCSNDITETLSFADEALFRKEDDLDLDLELSMLLSKESEQMITRVLGKTRELDQILSGPRREAVEWILQATSHHCFSAITALLAVDYLDRFIFQFDGFQRDQKPWMTELAAVACLSLAAKVEEIQVPLLLDLQVEGTSKFMFEAKTIQRMEIIVLSTLQWRMNPVTSLLFLHHISKRLGLKERLAFEFLKRCEITLLSVLSDHRFMSHLPSAMAAATTLHVVYNIVTPTVATEYEEHLMGILKIDKDNVEKCRQFINESVLLWSHGRFRSNKRKLGPVTPGSPNGVIDVSFSSDGPTTSSFSSSSVTSSPEAISKKSKSTTTTERLK